MNTYIKAGAAALALIAASGTAQAANLLVNGGFEIPPVPANSFTLHGNGGNIGGWNVFGPGTNSVLAIHTGYTESGIAFPAHSGQVALDLTGGGNVGPTAGVSQTVATTIGALYNLSFWVGNASSQTNNNYGQNSRVRYQLNGVNHTNFINNQTTTNSINWHEFTTSFVATTATTTIGFFNDTTGDNYAGLDDVLLEAAAVPEPTTWAMMMLGFAAMGFAMRRKKSALRVKFA